MSFEAKRLRVQLPCREAESVVERVHPGGTPCGQQTGPFRPTICMAGTIPNCFGVSEPACGWNTGWCERFSTAVCRFDTCGFVTPIGGQPGCGPVTEDPRELIEIVTDPEKPGAVLLDPDDLPRLREQLKAELEKLEGQREDLKGQLEELDSVQANLEQGSEG